MPVFRETRHGGMRAETFLNSHTSALTITLIMTENPILNKTTQETDLLADYLRHHFF